MAQSNPTGSKQDRLWAEVKQRCRLNRRDILMAKELGLNPRSLIKNMPSPNQQWKLPVKHWIHQLHEKNNRKTTAKKHAPEGSRESDEHSENGSVRLRAHANEPALTPERRTAPVVDEMMTTWDEHANALQGEDEQPSLPESPLHREIAKENQRIRKRQNDFRRAAEYVARAFGEISGVEKVVLFGSTVQPPRDERPRFRKYRSTGIPMLHVCKDIDLAVWVSDLGCLQTMQKTRARALNLLFQEHKIGIAHYQVDVFIMEPGSDLYLGRLCTYSQCLKGKPECRVLRCGSVPLLRQHQHFEMNTTALLPDKSVILV